MMSSAENTYDKYSRLADELLDDSRAYRKLLPEHKALEERCRKAECELSKVKENVTAAVRHITDIVKLSNCILVPFSGYEDLAKEAAPVHKALANVIRRLCSKFVRSLGFDKEADYFYRKARISEEAKSEFRSIEESKQKKGVKR